MSKAPTHSLKLGRPESSTSTFDMCAMVPVVAFAYAEIVSPLLMYLTSVPTDALLSPVDRLQLMMRPRLENKIFWPTLAAITVVLVLRNRSRLALPPHIKCLFAYLAFAGASVVWAFNPEISFSRFVLQIMILTSIVLTGLLAARTADMMRGLFLCLAFACVLNIPFVLNQEPIIYQGWELGRRIDEIIGYPGYFSFKGILGECAAVAFLLSLHELLHSGWRRALSIIVIVVALWLVYLSKSKGSFGLAILAPILAWLTLTIGKKMRISPAIVIFPIAIFYQLLTLIPGLNLLNRISYNIYGNYTLSGRTIIWDFVNYEIGRSPLIGWGYQSFWLAGPGAPSIVDAPGWVKGMPSSHNGYLDTMVDTGYVGFALFVIFIFATLHAIGRVADREPTRAWLLLTLALFVMLTNMLESVWMRGMEPLWLLFLIVAADTGRYWRPFQRAVSEPMRRGPGVAGWRPGPARAWGPGKPARFEKRQS
jgi:exopolysaccharide production protein ExoQ